MAAKLKIDLNQGTLEVEGTETFVKAIYTDFKAQFLGEDAVETLSKPTTTRRRRRKKVVAKPQVVEAAPVLEEAALPQPVKTEALPEPSIVETLPTPELVEVVGPSDGKPGYTLLKSLDLAATGSRPSLVEYMDTKFPITNEERNLVFVHYLQHLLKEKAITGDHIYTCYRAVKIRVPSDLDGSLQTTANQRRWIRMTKTGRLSVTAAGKSYIENQLPKKLRN